MTRRTRRYRNEGSPREGGRAFALRCGGAVARRNQGTSALLGVAGCNYIMGIPGADDIMLGYQSTSFHDSHYLRQVLGLKPAPEFEAWLEKMRIVSGGQRLLPVGEHHALIDHVLA